MKYLVIHCSATPPKLDIGAKEIDTWHKKRGWREIGYHYVIRRDGTIENGRDYNEKGAHVKGYNKDSHGICLVGGVNEDGASENNFTRFQFARLERVIRAYLQKYPDIEILGHRDFWYLYKSEAARKACPSFSVEMFLKEIGIKCKPWIK